VYDLRVRVLVSDGTELPLPPEHPFPVAKYARLRERVAGELVGNGVELVEARPATDDELVLVHDPEYLRMVEEGSLPASATRRIGLPWSPELVARARGSVGATVAAAAAALADGVAVTLGGGTHHASRAAGAGFCVFNDVMVAIRVLQRDGRVRRVLVVDCDVHQGDGTAVLSAGDPSVFTFSIHGARNFPARKQVSSLDVALPDGTGDDGYLAALVPNLERSLAASRADLAFYLAGADPYRDDRWGRLGLSKAGLAERDRLVLEACRRHGLPTAVTMAGGYARSIDDIVDIHLATVRIAAELSPWWHAATVSQ
jgi:acetoin utilization deacetylase AcuC-like enzyme